MSQKRPTTRNPTLDIIGVALIGLLIYWIVLPFSDRSGEVPEENDIPEAPPPATFIFSANGIKDLSPSIREAKLSLIGDPAATRESGRYQVDITIEKAPNTSSANDWNVIAHDVRSLSGVLFKTPDPARISFAYVDPTKDQPAWARIHVARTELPEDWLTLSYLKFFSMTQAEGGTLESRTWLCDFFRQHTNAQPGGSVPENCDMRGL